MKFMLNLGSYHSALYALTNKGGIVFDLISECAYFLDLRRFGASEIGVLEGGLNDFVGGSVGFTVVQQLGEEVVGLKCQYAVCVHSRNPVLE